MLIDFELCQVQATKMECIALEESVYLISLLEEISLPQLWSLLQKGGNS